MMEEHPVYVHIYDLTKGLARSMSGPLLGRQLDGVWHTGIVAYGQEFYFGGMGIESCPPCGTILGSPDKKQPLGVTQIPVDMFMDYLQDLGASSFRPEKYHLLEHNCNTFSNEVAQFLTGQPIPEYITNLPQEVLNTPLGAMLKPFIDAMSVSPGGGQPIGPAPTSIHQGNSSSGNTQPGIPGSANPLPPKLSPATGDSASPSGGDLPSEPVSYKELESIATDLAGVKADLVSSLGSRDAGILDEMMDYLRKDQPDWSLSTSHIAVIERILRDSGFSTVQKVAAAGLLQESLNREDVMMMLKHDTTALYANILRLFEQHDDQVILQLAKGVCNCCSHGDGLEWLTKEPVATGDGICTVSRNICRYCLLHVDGNISSTGATLCHNLTRKNVSEELAFDFGCALVELLQRDLDTITAKHAIIALCRCMDSNDQVSAVAAVSGVKSSTLAAAHPSLSELCNNQLKAHLAPHDS